MKYASAAVRITEPATPAGFLATLKSHLRVDTAAEDALLTLYLNAAIGAVEDYTRRAVFTQKWRAEVATILTGEAIYLPRPAIDGATLALTYRNEAGTWAAVTSALYRLRAGEPARVTFDDLPSDLDPSEDDNDGHIRIEYFAGWATEALVPPQLRGAILLLAANLFENRVPVVVGSSVATLPFGYDLLLNPFRVPWEAQL